MKRKCINCAKEFERDLNDKEIQMFYREAGAIADQCEECLKQWIKEQRGD